MNGATADPWLKIIKKEKIIKKIIKGNNQNFFLLKKNKTSSFKISIISF